MDSLDLRDSSTVDGQLGVLLSGLTGSFGIDSWRSLIWRPRFLSILTFFSEAVSVFIKQLAQFRPCCLMRVFNHFNNIQQSLAPNTKISSLSIDHPQRFRPGTLRPSWRC
jgi:hypothetical protein